MRIVYVWLVLLLAMLTTAVGHGNYRQQRPLPKEVRGYKVHRARVEPAKSNSSVSRRTENNSGQAKDDYDEDEPLLIRLGEPILVSVSPLGITFDIPVILPPVKQQGEVDLLVFEDMRVNDTEVSIDDHPYKFKLPNKNSLVLNPPIRIFVSTPQAVLRTIDEIFNSREVWPITGRIYVCGQFKKFLIKFKRAVPVELDTSIKNPIRL
jgi:hypothetical protein